MSYPSNRPDGVAADQIRSFVDRIIRLKEEARAINDDVREVYGEAKSEGFDKTILGKLVNYVEKRNKDAAAVAESEAIFDLYLEAYFGTGTPVATHAHEKSHAKASTGNAVSATVEAVSAPEATEETPEADGSGDVSRPSDGGGPVAIVEGERPEVAALPADNVHVLPERAPLRPHCLKPGPQCAGQGRQHCYTCQKALADSEGMSA